MRFEDLRVGETFTLASETPAPWRVVLRKVSDERAEDDRGASLPVGAEESVVAVGGAALTHALWVEHDGAWRLVMRWQAPREPRPRWHTITGDPVEPSGEESKRGAEDRRARALLAGALLARSESRDAIAIYDELIAERPEAAILNNRGAARAAAGDVTAAIADYTQALALDDRLAQAWSNRGNALSKLGRHAEALRDYDRALELAGPDEGAAIRCNRGLARKLVGDLEGSLADLDAALTVDPRFGPAFLARGSVRATRGDVAGALDDLRRFLEVAPEAPQAEQVRTAISRLEEVEESR